MECINGDDDDDGLGEAEGDGGLSEHDGPLVLGAGEAHVGHVREVAVPGGGETPPVLQILDCISFTQVL